MLVLRAMRSDLPRPIPVHTTTTHYPGGHVRERHSVACPRQGRFVDADACFGCERLASVSLDPKRSRYEVSCYAGASPPLRSADAVDGKVPIGAVMTRDVWCVASTSLIEDVTRILLDHDISGAPVVDDEGRALGVVSKTDVLRAMHERRGKRVIDIMTGLEVSLPETATVAQAAALMAFEAVHRVVVLSDDGKVIGIVSSMDVLRFIGETTGYLR